MCLSSSPASAAPRKEETRRDMTYAYKDAGLEEIKVPTDKKKGASNKSSETKVVSKATKTPLNIG